MKRVGDKPSPLVIAAGVCLLLALASLALPSGPTYDPYAWLIWGRDLAHLQLATNGTGTSWKPLPAVVDALLSPLGGGAAGGWLVVARAGGAFALFMAGRLAWRLAPPRERWLAALVAVAALALTRLFFRQTAIGYAEGLMVALGLLAIDRHLDGHRGQAFALIVAAGLIRVEAWPFAVGYGAWLTRREPGRMPAFVTGVVLLPLLWFGGDWVGSGRLTTAADRALNKKPGSPGASAHPVLAAFQEIVAMMPWPTWLGVVLAGVLLARRRSSNSRAVALLAGCAAIWTTIVAAMAQRGYAGLPRFMFMACALAAIVAGAGFAQAVAMAPRPALRYATVATLFAVLLVGMFPKAQLLPADASAVDHVADIDATLTRAVRAAGGPEKMLRCGPPVTAWWTVTALAWDLRVGPGSLHDRPLGSQLVVDRCPSRS
jgi:hypothetical protein